MKKNSILKNEKYWNFITRCVNLQQTEIINMKYFLFAFFPVNLPKNNQKNIKNEQIEQKSKKDIFKNSQKFCEQLSYL